MKPGLDVRTPYQFILWAEQKFEDADLYYGHGTDNAYDEAAYLILRGLGLPFDLDDVDLNQELPAEKIEFLVELIRCRVEKRLPVAYLLNEAWFCGLSFYVDDSVLIPRSPIAELIADRFSPWCEVERVSSIVDIGTGSGCIAIASALSFPAARVDAVDISRDALAVAEENVRRHELSDRIRLIRSNLYESLAGQHYDIIIANPPYVDESDMDTLPEEYRHEPGLALAAGDDGLDIVRHILSDSREYMSDNGILVCEVGNSQEALMEAYPDYPFFWFEFEFGGHGVFLLTAAQLDQL
ncbi:MAG: 50S ribosomal protein L3 N(5)-glutamine methyltransferase [Gammaproteobacteria bacterium]|nr:50S ribosomal protein L3 N(5)-glutamine methyltransferase [Gammaproteobacteria bacterium]